MSEVHDPEDRKAIMRERFNASKDKVDEGFKAFDAPGSPADVPQSGFAIDGEHVSFGLKGVSFDPQKEKAKELDLTWKFEGEEYALALVNGTGNVGSSIVNPATQEKAGILFADFGWDDNRPFIDHLNLNLRDVRNNRDEESVRKRANSTAQNARLFAELVHSGSVVKINAQGEQTEPLPRTREELLAMAPEIQSQLIDDWLTNFHIQRYLPAGMDDIDSLLSPAQETISFTAKIGNFKSPSHVLLFEFTVPSPDARRNYEDASFNASSKQEGDNSVTTYHINLNAKLRFAKAYFRSVKGVVLAPNGSADIETFSPFSESSTESVNSFKKLFNPHWWIRLADELAGAFNFTGK